MGDDFGIREGEVAVALPEAFDAHLYSSAGRERRGPGASNALRTLANPTPSVRWKSTRALPRR